MRIFQFCSCTVRHLIEALAVALGKTPSFLNPHVPWIETDNPIIALKHLKKEPQEDWNLVPDGLP